MTVLSTPGRRPPVPPAAQQRCRVPDSGGGRCQRHRRSRSSQSGLRTPPAPAAPSCARPCRLGGLHGPAVDAPLRVRSSAHRRHSDHRGLEVWPECVQSARENAGAGGGSGGPDSSRYRDRRSVAGSGVDLDRSGFREGPREPLSESSVGARDEHGGAFHGDLPGTGAERPQTPRVEELCDSGQSLLEATALGCPSPLEWPTHRSPPACGRARVVSTRLSVTCDGRRLGSAAQAASMIRRSALVDGPGSPGGSSAIPV